MPAFPYPQAKQAISKEAVENTNQRERGCREIICFFQSILGQENVISAYLVVFASIIFKVRLVFFFFLMPTPK